MVKPQYDRLLAIFNSMEVHFRTPKGSNITAELMKLNLRRNNSYMGIRGIIKGQTYSVEAAKRTSAELLKNHLANYGTAITRVNYLGKTGIIRNILNDWRANDGLTAALSELGLQAAVIELENANRLFSEQYRARVIKTASLSTRSMQTVRSAAKNAWYELRIQLNAHYVIQNGADPFGNTVDYINGLLISYNNLLARRADGDITPPGASDTTGSTAKSTI